MESEPESEQADAGKEEGFPSVRVRTNFGPFVIRLRPDLAPATVENFLGYVREGYYDNTVFHRVVGGFVAQGGGYERGLHPKHTRAPIGNEAGPDGLANAALTVAMARTSDPHSATSQFYVNLADNPALDFSKADDESWGYCVFGEVTEGAEAVEAIGAVDTEDRMGMPGVPVNDVVIESIRVEGEAEEEEEEPEAGEEGAA